MLQREPVGIEDLALYPLFDDRLLALMRRLIAPHKQDAVGVAIIVRARRGKVTSGPRSSRPRTVADRALA